MVSEFIRTMKLQIEERTGINIRTNDDIYHWMVRWAPMLSSRFVIGAQRENAT